MANQLVSLDESLQKKKSFILQVKVYVSPKDVDTFMNLFRPIYQKVVAEKECTFFVVGVDDQPSPLDPPDMDRTECVCISWTEGWSETVDWFMNVQFKRDYYPAYLEATEKLFVKPREIQFLAPQTGMNHFKTQ